MEEKNDINDFVNFILNDEVKEKEKELGLEHPSVEYEAKEREVVDKVLEERSIEERLSYYTCKRFKGEERGVCDKLNVLGRWLKEKDGLDMQPLIDTLLLPRKDDRDMNPTFQEPLKYLYETGKFKDISLKDGYYTSQRLLSCELVRDKNGEWIFVNKLNTSWSDLAELLTTLFMRGGKIEELKHMNVTEIKNFLLNLRNGGKPTRKKPQSSHLYRLLEKYFNVDEYDDYTYNTRKNTIIGDEIEDLTIKLLEKQGFKLIYHGNNGNFIDMKYGIDMIMELEGKVYLIQVKSKSNAAKMAMDYPNYRYIDLFAGETSDNNGIMLYDRDSMKEGEFIAKDILQDNLDYLINKYSN